MTPPTITPRKKNPVRFVRTNRPGRKRTAGPKGRLLATLALLGLGGLAACGGSDDGGTTGPTPPPPPPPPPEPEVTCAETSEEDSEGPWRAQASPVDGALSRVQFLDASVGRAVQRNRDGRTLTLLRTSDGGSTWCSQEISSSQTTDMGHFLAFRDAEVGFTGGQACTLLQTRDGGASWSGGGICASERWLLSIEIIDADRMWVGGGGGLLFRSGDGGQSWNRISVDGLDGPVFGIEFVSPEVGILVQNVPGDIYRTVDGGETWEGRPHEGGSLVDVAFASPTTVVATEWEEEGRILRSTDAGETWEEVERAGVRLGDIDFGTDGFGVALGEQGTILVSTDAGASWVREDLDGFSGILAGVSVLDAEHAWVVGDAGTILVRAAQ